MKVLFLDHNGVVYIKNHPNHKYLDSFDPGCVKILNSILEQHKDIEIVVSSDWKYWVSLEEMKSFYTEQGIIKQPVAYTKKLDRQNRHLEILDYLNANEGITNWIAIDDIDMRSNLTNFVWIRNWKDGLYQSNVVNEILSILNK